MAAAAITWPIRLKIQLILMVDNRKQTESRRMSKDLAQTQLLLTVQKLIGQNLSQVEKIYLAELNSWHAYVTDILEHVSRFRGKRIRPILLLLSAHAGGQIKDAHHALAAVIEMIHTATLVHDDVLDNATTRRHVATVNTRWNNETSVLFGDYLFTHAFHLASTLETTLACRMIGRATNTVCVGELAQIHERGNIDLDEATYLRIIDSKTAELCAVSCLLGAHYADADEATIKSMEAYGRALGIAFQITDDLLDLTGQEDMTGKSLGTDLDQQKLTLPLIRLLQQADEEVQRELRELIANPTEDSRATLLTYLAGSDAMSYAQQRAEEYAEQARACLNCLPDSQAKSVLEEITEFSIRRAY